MAPACQAMQWAHLTACVQGISIRFPRLLRVRDDKDPDQATGADQVVEWYQKQALASKPQADDD